MLMNLTVECLHKLFEILLHGRFLFPLGLFVSFSKMLFIYLRESEKESMNRGGAEREGESDSSLSREPNMGLILNTRIMT